MLISASVCLSVCIRVHINALFNPVGWCVSSVAQLIARLSW